MASFDEHLNQAVKNIRILEQVNNSINDSWDWQVTIGFYVALHLANAHLARTLDAHYRTHAQVSEAINPYVVLNVAKFEEDAFLSYQSLQNLSRRSRYLLNDKNVSIDPECAHFTSEKQFAKAIRELEKILTYFNKVYGYKFLSLKIKCEKIKSDKLNYFAHLEK